jgi:predicted  nucleic acid-binding Zn-ribbon protein
MNEANQNANPVDADALFSHESDHIEQQKEPREFASESSIIDHNSCLKHYPDQGATQEDNNSHGEERESVTGIMDWQRVAHKLREYNRKLLKKVFRLEQELAEIDNKFNKYVEKSQNSDLLLANQAEELTSYQEQVTLLIQQLAGSQQQIETQELLIKEISQRHEFSQQQTAQLERECTLLQEKYNQQSFELVSKEQETQELQNQLHQQHYSVLQQEAQLKRYQEAASRKEKTVTQNQNYPHNRFIKPWSTSTIPEPKIAVPKNKSQATKVKKTAEAIKTAAEIATWSASSIPRKIAPQAAASQPQVAQANHSANHSKKPQSLAAVDLPTFPRPQ